MFTQLRVLAAVILLVLAGNLLAAPPSESSWRYYRPGNTGVMGDYSDALWVDPEGTLYHAGYDPFFEEGGFARFRYEENRWENFSNVDYPVIGPQENTGTSRISDICPDAQGGLWMGTWRGMLYFDPAVGASSLRRFDAGNSPLPGGRTMDLSVAPDGSVWLACFGVSWGGGGLARYVPDTDTWTVWGYDPQPDGWPGRVVCETAIAQPKPGGGYLIWVDDSFGKVVYDSDTQQFSDVPFDQQPGDIAAMLANDACDDAGNVWMLRYTVPGQTYTLEYRRPDGTWVQPPQPLPAMYGLPAFRAFGDGQCLLIGGSSDAWYFDGTAWTNLGIWRPGGFTFAIDMDTVGNVYVSGNGGLGRRDAATGLWQRYRLSNTGQIDNWVRDLAFADNGDVWLTSNGAPGIGGMARFDGQRWFNWNVATYGLGGDWPFPCDNADAICFRPSTGDVALNPTNNGIREWDGSGFVTLEPGSVSDGLVEDSLGRLWTMGNYYSLRYHDGNGFVDVGIDGWGANVVRDPDQPGTVWACAGFEVVRTDGVDRFSREVPDFPELNPMHDLLTTVVAAPGGVAWVGSTEGLIRLDAETGAHQWFHHTNSDIPGDQITPLVVSPDGLVWCTNFNSQGMEGALIWFDGVEFGTFTRAEGLPHEQIYDAEVREIVGGYEIWLACASRGIAVLTVMSDEVTEAPDENMQVRLNRPLVHPNPFNPRTSITFAVEHAGEIRVDVLDLRGRLVRTLMAGRIAAGRHAVSWDGTDRHGRPQPSATYLCRIQSHSGAKTAKLQLVR